MTGKTKIEWAEATWNPIVGCKVVSPGCTNCYAMKMGHRLAANPATPHYAGTTQKSRGGPVWTGKVALAPDRVLTAPLRRRKPTTYFVNSMGDLFAEGVPDDWIDRVFAVMALCPQHTFLVLTKRSGRMRTYFAHVNAHGETRHEIIERKARFFIEDADAWMTESWPLPNVWLGVSAEDQQRADERIPDLLATPAALRFVSAEPLLGPVDFRRWLATANVTCKKCGFEFWLHEADPCEHRNDGGEWTLACPSCGNCKCKSHGPKEAATFGIPHTWKWKPVGRFDRVHHSIELVSGIDWIIAGGESGPGAREWDEFANSCRDIRDQCKNAGVPFFMKQMVKKAAIPDDLRVRESPNA